MTVAVQETVKYIIAPLLAPAIGGLIALRTNPSRRLQSVIQHLAAGLVFAAATIELLPVLVKGKQPLASAIGFLLGLGGLLIVKRMFGGHYHGDKDESFYHQHFDDESSQSITPMAAAVSLDVAVDGLLVGLGFAIGSTEGRLLTLAMTVEVLFIGMSMLSSCRERKLAKSKSLAIAASSGLILAVMAVVGAKVVSVLHGGVYQAVLAFGIAALLYLVTEELLIEAHETPDEPVETTSFFLGFLAILLLTLV